MIVETSIRYRVDILPRRARKVRSAFNESLVSTSLIEVLASRVGMVDETVEGDVWLGMAM